MSAFAMSSLRLGATAWRGASRRSVRCCSARVEITRDVVEKTAKLASLQLSDEEVGRITPELQNIVGFVEQINAVDVSGVEPTLRVEDLWNVLREDQPAIFPAQDEMLEEAPQLESDYVRVPKILAEAD
uniref:Glutamyl-tRNA(Gln) amidotransferase subunit C, mitochondrial n=1 Tax=Rhodosorus marinus TaxID=101924 RepID=A0A6T6MT11_9RHOD|mmetsp:Transcript_21706/g.31496  ORF Transcript_21706/g.31496 Transcript_21706/m.31496 type:complete len:129 (+) Transcript_21706:111-497(+)